MFVAGVKKREWMGVISQNIEAMMALRLAMVIVTIV